MFHFLKLNISRDNSKIKDFFLSKKKQDYEEDINIII